MPIGVYNHIPKIKPNLEINENLAYLLGAIKGDGNVSNNKKYFNINMTKSGGSWHKQYRFCFYNQNFDFLRNIYHSMKDIGLRPTIKNEAKVIAISACSKIMWEWYQELNLTKLELMLKQNMEYILAFLRGFYEAEGSYYYETGIYKPFVSIINCNFELISLINKLIFELGFSPKLYKIKRGRTAFKKGYFYLIHIKKKNDAERFIEKIKPNIKNIPSNQWFNL